MSGYSPFTNKLDSLWRLAIPHLVTIAFMIVNTSIMTGQALQPLKPDFVLMIIFYWAVYRPSLMPPAAVFMIGLVLDIISGTPVGLNTASYIAVQWTVRDQRKFLMGQPFVTLWLGYALVCMAVTIVQWGFFALFYQGHPEIIPALVRLGVSVLIFPPVVLLLHMIHRLMPGTASGSFPY